MVHSTSRPAGVEAQARVRREETVNAVRLARAGMKRGQLDAW